MKEYRKKNKEKIRAQEKAYKNAHKEHYKENARKWREKNREYVAELKRKWVEKNQEHVRDYARQWEQDHKDIRQAINKKSKEKHPYEGRARYEAQYAIFKGVLKREACEVCGAEKTDAHHDDYNEPLKVRWLCRKHHMEWHKNNDPKRRDTSCQE